MTGNVLLDRNVIVYAYDRSTLSKQQRALEAMRGLARSGRGRLSAQVLGEFYQIETVLTEDFTDGRAIEGVRFVNPFSRSFDLARFS